MQIEYLSSIESVPRWQHHPIVIQDYFLMQTLESISVPALDDKMKKNIEEDVKSITIPMMCKMFLFGSYVKNQALRRKQAKDPSESTHHQSLCQTTLYY